MKGLQRIFHCVSFLHLAGITVLEEATGRAFKRQKYN